MQAFSSLLLLLLPFLCQSAKVPSSRWAAVDAVSVAFIPRGGALGRRSKKTPDTTDAPPPAAEADDEDDESEESTETETPFDLQEVSNELRNEELADIREAQQLLQKQQQRRALDKSLLDKGITGFVEFFENLFSWKVIDV